MKIKINYKKIYGGSLFDTAGPIDGTADPKDNKENDPSNKFPQKEEQNIFKPSLFPKKKKEFIFKPPVFPLLLPQYELKKESNEDNNFTESPKGTYFDLEHIRELGKGKFGKISEYKNKDVDIRNFAVKESINKLLSNEINCIDGKKDDYILKYYKYYENNIGVGRLVMEKGNQNLSSLINEYKDDVNKRYLLSIIFLDNSIQALKELHSNTRGQSKIHLDIKPDNFIVFGNLENADFKIKLADFGSCSNLGESLNIHDTFTLGYSSPEIINYFVEAKKKKIFLPEIKITPELDLYSLGVTYLQILINLDLTLFNKIDINQLNDEYIKKIEEINKIDIPEDQKENCKKICTGLLSKIPKKRIDIFKDVEVIKYFNDNNITIYNNIQNKQDIQYPS